MFDAVDFIIIGVVAFLTVAMLVVTTIYIIHENKKK